MTHHLIARRRQTPVPSSGSSSPSGGQMPDELVHEQVGRLALFSAIGGGLWMLGLALDLVLLRAADSTFVPALRITAVEVLGVLTALAMYWYVRYSPHDLQVKTNVGLGYMLVNAFGVALLNAWTFLPMQVPAMHVSWNAVIILVFSMVAPTTPRRIFGASLLAATMDPLAVWLLRMSGEATPTLLTTFVLYIPNYAAAVVAALPAHVFQRMNRRLREAQELGSYRLVERLGEGGMGEVWRAEHRLLARSAAVKLVRPEVLGAGSDDETRLVLRRFEREARATAALSSPHTIQVFDFGTTEQGNFYYVMELLTGRDLESLVRTFGPLPAHRAVFLLRQVCHSLADAHARGMVHRDIKPANIYACRMGLEYDFVKVLDFGLVKLKDKTPLQQTLVTLDHKTTGTPAYMAPEIILGETSVDRRADVYALGCVAYYLLTGQLVFEADTPMKMLMQHVQARPVPPSQRTELPIPPELDDIVMACLEKDPDRRPQDALEMFRLTCGCHSCDGWTHERARTWWETHLPELTGPLVVNPASADLATSRIMVAR